MCANGAIEGSYLCVKNVFEIKGKALGFVVMQEFATFSICVHPCTSCLTIVKNFINRPTPVLHFAYPNTPYDCNTLL